MICLLSICNNLLKYISKYLMYQQNWANSVICLDQLSAGLRKGLSIAKFYERFG